ncbi:hypothetical protein [Flavobacterium sp.]|uniref:hypothetical protein n=1 Tax=Flavobacterium sp. TaxID=239 RepID=UPI0039E37688
MEEQQYELVVSSGDRPLGKTILAAGMFTAVLYLLYEIVSLCWQNQAILLNPKFLAGYLELIGIFLSGGVYFSMTKTVLIDTDQDQLISRFAIGPFTKNIITKVPQLDYVSVFKNSKDLYEVNLWYYRNKHYKMCVFGDKKPAFGFAEMVSDKLKLDILDATESGNSKWVEREPV